MLGCRCSGRNWFGGAHHWFRRRRFDRWCWHQRVFGGDPGAADVVSPHGSVPVAKLEPSRRVGVPVRAGRGHCSFLPFGSLWRVEADRNGAAPMLAGARQDSKETSIAILLRSTWAAPRVASTTLRVGSEVACDMTEPNQPPPGWYPDPSTPGYQRYWDGTAWTDQKHPMTLAMNPPAVTGSPAATPAGTGVLPWWQNWWAVILGLLLCFPFGLIGLWKRPGVTTKVRWWLTGATAALLVIAFTTTQGNASTPTNQDAVVPPGASSRPTLVAVPKVTGLSRTRARAALVALGMTVGQVSTQPSRLPVGTILRQSDAAGTGVVPGSAEDLVVAGPLPHVPNVIGRSKTNAEQGLRSAGFSVGISTRTVTSGPSGVVLAETPGGGTAAMPGTRVQLVVSVLRVPPPPPTQAPAPPPGCTTTSSGTCIRGGEFCPQADYGMVGYDANGTPYTCTGDQTHPHWE